MLLSSGHYFHFIVRLLIIQEIYSGVEEISDNWILSVAACLPDELLAPMSIILSHQIICTIIILNIIILNIILLNIILLGMIIDLVVKAILSLTITHDDDGDDRYHSHPLRPDPPHHYHHHHMPFSRLKKKTGNALQCKDDKYFLKGPMGADSTISQDYFNYSSTS